MHFIPQVKSFHKISDKTFKVTQISFSGSNVHEEVKKDFSDFCRLKSTTDGAMLFENDPALKKEEYKIVFTDGVFRISSNSSSGEIYALQTIKQVLFQTDFEPYEFEIFDSPDYKIRGFMLDVGRYFFCVEDVKKIIRRMALHKLNLLHWHLTEDQGWRIEIEAYPLLTEIGSKRACTNFNNKPHMGYYTKKDIAEIVDYAHRFGIKIMPEFDIPGHSRAAIAAYNTLTCYPRDLPVATHWGVKHDVLCVGKDSTMEFVYKVLDEFCEMFPDEYFHIGGDEVPKQRWNSCPHCQKKIKELGLKSADELQFWFMNSIKDYLKEKGKQTFMWSWDLENSNMLDEDLGFTLCGDMDNLKARPFIDTSTAAYYIDLPYGSISLKDSVNHKPHKGNCLGVEGTLWSEYVPDMKKADIMSFPRTGAICETGWNGSASYADFENKLDFYYSFLDKNNIGYALPVKANPNKLRAFFSRLWFEKRQLTWEGLTNLIWDKKYSK